MRGKSSNSVNLHGVVQIVGGDRFACALLNSQRVRCWGTGSSGWGGSAGYANRDMAADSANNRPLENVTQLDAGSSSVCSINDSGKMFCWGGGFTYPRRVKGRSVLDVGTYQSTYFCHDEYSGCKRVRARLSFAEGTTSPSSSTALTIKAGGLATGETMTVYSDSSCTIEVVSSLSDGDVAAFIRPDTETITRYYFRINEGKCEQSYLAHLLDKTPPYPSLTTYFAIGGVLYLEISGLFPGDYIEVYRGRGCNDRSVEAMPDFRVSTTRGSFSRQFQSIPQYNNFYVKSTDEAGNESGCIFEAE